MVFRLSLFTAVLLLLSSWPFLPVSALADDGLGGDEFLFQVRKAAEAGELTAEGALLCKFQYLFAPENLPAAFQIDDPAPLKCGTPLMREYQEMGKELAAETNAEISIYLESFQIQSATLSPSGRFQLSYSLIGEDAVPAEDVDPANGIPDYVERIGGYLDQAWEIEFIENGFTAPVCSAGPYPVTFQDMAAYGYTIITDQAAGATRIVLHNDYECFPPNDDPDGNRWGAAKVTAAHELKHASQYAASRWSEGGWIELDAVWAEELAFDQVNDYYTFLTGESPLRRPDLSLDSGICGSGSYEDAVFQIWLEQTWGVEIIHEFWARRSTHRTESVIATWEQVLAGRGVSFAEGWALFTVWNYGTDQRAVQGIGYDEARDYPCGRATACDAGQPFTHSGSVDHLAARQFRLDGFAGGIESGEEDRLEIILSGSGAGGELTLAVHVTKWGGSGLEETATLDGAGSLRHLVGVPWNEIQSVGVVVGNSAKDGPACAFELTTARVSDPDLSPMALDAWSVDVDLGRSDTVRRSLTLSHTMVGGPDLDYTVELCSRDPRGTSDGGLPAETPLTWLKCDPTMGRLAAGAETTLSLDFSSEGLPNGTHRCWLGIRAEGAGDFAADPAAFQLAIPLTLTVSGGGGLLQGSHPNPFNPVTWIRFELPADARVRMDVLDLRGRVVRRLLDGTREAGSHKLAWNGRDDSGALLGAGLYLARLCSGGRQFTCKMILAK